MPAKKKKRTKNRKQPGLITPKNTFVQRHKWLVVVIVFILGGSIGVTLQQRSQAEAECVPYEEWDVHFPCLDQGDAGCQDTGYHDTFCYPRPDHNPFVSNPPVATTCKAGKAQYDIPIFVDSSNSMWGQSAIQAAEAVRALVAALQGWDMTFGVGRMDEPDQFEFTTDTDKALRNFASMGASGGFSYLPDLRPLLAKDPRPHVQNFIVVITDGGIYVHSSIQEVKAKGNRVLAVSVQKTAYTSAHVYMAGPKVNTGNIWTSDIITVQTKLNMNASDYFNQMKEEFLKIAQQLKICPSGNGGGGNGNGSGGSGTGNNGNGDGTGGTGNGQGRQGTGSGRQGTGSGGGGTSATRQGNSPNPLPTPSPQGSKKQDPPKQEPSPFFDGKLYGIGSDPDAQSPADLVRSPGKALKNVWFYIIGGIMVIGGGVGAGWWFWWRKRIR